LSILPNQLTVLLRESIALNSTAFEAYDNGKKFIGSQTETALLGLARDYLGMGDVAIERRNAKPRIVADYPFISERRCMGVVCKTEVEGRIEYRLFIKGASEVILQQSTQVIDISNIRKFNTIPLSKSGRKDIADTIESYATHSLRTIALAYRDFLHWPPTSEIGKDGTNFEFVFKDMVFIGVVGIKDPLRSGVTKAVTDCRRAGVTVRMVTGDNVATAKAIATECGIYTGGIVMEGPEFRKLSVFQRNRVLPKLQVLARALPDDKRKLVRSLKKLGEIVAVTGDGTNDGPALKAADVGFSMGIAGTEVARAASSIILLDDNFASIVKAISWGRCVCDAVKKFLQVRS
jgi:Ca2+-transporting ATPase